MKNTFKKLSLLGLAFAFVISSCTMEKRQYRSGYHIDWHKNKNAQAATTAPKVKKLKNVTAKEQTGLAISLATQAENQVTTFNQPVIASTTVNLPKVNGVKNNSVKNNNVVENTVVTSQIKPIDNNSVVVPTKPAKTKGSKSQLIALILCALVGGLGIHRFYLGYIWQGVVQLLTAGGCGIWWIIDLVRIITGDLEPKDGSYDETL